MVFLIGVQHEIQYKGASFPWREPVNEFLNHVEAKVLELNVTTIAEEWSEDCNQMNNVEFSSLQGLATKLGLKHILCDPTREERYKNIINDSDKREEFWIERLKEVLDEDFIFICGDDHLKSFKRKLELNKIPVAIISEKWGKRQTPTN